MKESPCFQCQVTISFVFPCETSPAPCEALPFSTVTMLHAILCMHFLLAMIKAISVSQLLWHWSFLYFLMVEQSKRC